MTRLLTALAGLLFAVPLCAAPVPTHLMKGRPLAEALKGEWQLTARVENGAESDAEFVKKRRMVGGDEKYVLFDGKEEYLTVEFKVDASLKPAHFDVTDPRFNQPGIVKVEGDVMTLCLGPTGGSRPTEFESPAGKSRILVTYKRVK